MSFIILFLKSYWKQILGYLIGFLILTFVIYKIYDFGKTVGINQEIANTKACEINHIKEVARVTEENAKNLADLSNKYSSTSDDLYQKLKDLKVKEKVIKDVQIKEIEKPIYHSCLIPDSGLQYLKDTGNTLNSTRSKDSK